jgi:SAM-dependent methyltransferase
MMSRYHLHRLRAVSQTIFIKVLRKRCSGYSAMKTYFEGKAGLEFGGPSSIFSSNHLIPVYNIAARVDNCDFAQQTLWTANHRSHRFGNGSGKRFVGDARSAPSFVDDSYDFIAASHVLEHVANPLRALDEWKRILKPSGAIVVVLPDKRGTFDHRRPFTSFDHVKADFESNVAEDDLAHLEEIVALHDLELDPPAGSAEQFRQRCLQNASCRAMHHHVFSPELLIEMFNFLDMRIVNVAMERPFHIIGQAIKSGPNEP